MNLGQQSNINKKYLINKLADKKINNKANHKVDKKAYFKQLGQNSQV